MLLLNVNVNVLNVARYHKLYCFHCLQPLLMYIIQICNYVMFCCTLSKFWPSERSTKAPFKEHLFPYRLLIVSCFMGLPERRVWDKKSQNSLGRTQGPIWEPADKAAAAGGEGAGSEHKSTLSPPQRLALRQVDQLQKAPWCWSTPSLQRAQGFPNLTPGSTATSWISSSTPASPKILQWVSFW